MRRLEQEAAARERRQSVLPGAGSDADNSEQDEREQQGVDDAGATCDAWRNVLKEVVQKLQQRCVVCQSQNCVHHDKSAFTKLDGLGRFMQQQQHMILELGHENARLWDQLQTLPTRHRFAVSGSTFSLCAFNTSNVSGSRFVLLHVAIRLRSSRSSIFSARFRICEQR